MPKRLVPMRWPEDWTDPRLFTLVSSTPINALLGADRLKNDAERIGLHILGAPAADSFTLVRGLTPGLRLSSGKGRDRVETGPTGTPWVNTNGWLVDVERAVNPDKPVFVETPVPEGVTPGFYKTAIADAASHGGGWVVTLDPALKALLASDPRKGSTDPRWQAIVTALRFFERHDAWQSVQTEAVAGVLADFTGSGRALSREVVNLTGRQHQPYRVLQSSSVRAVPEALRAIIYADSAAPAEPLRKTLLAWVERGGLLVTPPGWTEGAETAAPYPRYTIRKLGQGRVAVAKQKITDPYVIAADAQTILSHRYDLVRFWNGGSLGSRFLVAADRRSAVLHIINYASRSGADDVSARVAGPWKTAKLITMEHEQAAPVPCELQTDAIELHLPAIGDYAAVELWT